MFIKQITNQALRFVLLALVSLTFSVGAWAQNITVTGTVTDKSGEPIIGVYVLVQGTQNGTSTDIDGKYALEVPANATLQFTSMGYTDVLEAVNNRSVVNVTMVDDAVLLDDVVVTALGIKKDRKALGYSVTEMKASELMKNKQTNVVNSLAGKVAGVNVTQTGGAAGAGSAIVIRGGNSASESRDNQPLFVVDGIVYDNSTVVGGNSGTDGMTTAATTFSNRVMDINPEDIESMSILKGAAAAALYGSRAADGVVLITTKKGSEDGNVKVNFSTKYTYSHATSVPEIQSVYGRGSYDMNGVLQTEGVTSSWGAVNNGTVYDNIADFFQGSSVWDNSVSVAGGHKNGSFYLSASRFDQTGTIQNTGYDKTTFRFNGEQKFGRLTVGANVAYSVANTEKTLTSSGLYSGGGNGTMTALYGWSRSENMSHWLNEDGTKYRMFPNQPIEDDVENPYWIINKNKMTDKNERITGAVNASFKISEWLDLSYRMGVDSYVNDAYTYIAPGAAVRETYQNGRLSKSKVSYNYLNTNVMLNFHKTWGDWDVSALVGSATEMTDRVSQTQWGWNFVTPGTISFDNILQENKFFTEYMSKKRLVGVYGEARASWKNMVYLTVTGRNDWSSTLPVNNRSYFYPSVSASFAFTELLPKNDVLTFGKIRGSWAQVGKDADPYSTNTYMWGSTIVNGNFVGNGNSWTGGSPNLVPEKQNSWEIGAELRFFGGRLGLDYTYYNSETVNQIAAPRLAQSTGYIFLTINSGSVKNKGMELMITGTPVDTKDVTWDLTLNLSGNRGTLGDFVEGVDYFYVTSTQIGGVKAASIPNGGNFLALTGDRWLREKDADGKEIANGRYQVDATTGLYQLSNVQTNIVGNREPKMIGGLSSTLRWKDLSFSFLLDLRIGGDIYSGTQYYLTTKGQSMRTLDRSAVTVDGVDSKTMQPVTYTYEIGQTYTINGKQYSGENMIQQYWSNYAENAYNFITDVNWLKLRSLSLSYDFSKLISKQKVLKGLVATFSANNLFTITNYKGGMDPEVAAVGSAGGSGSVGIDYCGVPTQTSYSFGLNLTF
ncbi:MAG: SusC/RagA family TonB-linked outer membrane protein [Bacteroidales bacterium]|nr:SusC/RagA family TonB-linked outer membrane protein [Bacteroidales bacterium]